MKVIAEYKCYAVFKIPKDITLLSVDENNKVGEENVPFSWWIKYDTLYYYDSNCKVVKIECDNYASDSHDYKRPDGVEIDEDSDSDSDSDSEDED